MNEIDDAIGRVEILYRTLTGRDAPAADVPYAPIPAEHDPALHVQEQMDRLMRLMGGAPSDPAAMAASTWTPPMGVWEGPQDILFAVDIPGVTRDQIDVSIQGAMVVVSGRRSAPDGLPDAQRLRPRGAEQPLGSFRRVITLPPTVQRDQITAWLKDGVLWLRLPNEAAATVRNVAVS